jgi:hypothetical protein
VTRVAVDVMLKREILDPQGQAHPATAASGSTRSAVGGHAPHHREAKSLGTGGRRRIRPNGGRPLGGVPNVALRRFAGYSPGPSGMVSSGRLPGHDHIGPERVGISTRRGEPFGRRSTAGSRQTERA